MKNKLPLLCAATLLLSVTTLRAAETAEATTLYRDEFGIPHVKEKL